MEVGRVYLKIVLILLCTSLCHSLNMNIALLQFCSLPLLSILRLPLHVTLFSSFTALALGSFPGCSLEPSLLLLPSFCQQEWLPGGSPWGSFLSFVLPRNPPQQFWPLKLGKHQDGKDEDFFFLIELCKMLMADHIFLFFLWQLALHKAQQKMFKF